MKKTKEKLFIISLTILKIILFFTIAVWIEWMFAPWDTAFILPSIGTWQRGLNDFIDLGIGKYLIAFIPSLSNLHILKYRHYKISYPKLIIIELVYLISLIFFIFINTLLKLLFFDLGDAQYMMAIFPLLFILIITCIYWYAQYSTLKDSEKIKYRTENISDDWNHINNDMIAKDENDLENILLTEEQRTLNRL
jgi:hypothetical protein